MTDLTLISHDLCPYVQRAVIALTEKQVPFRRVDIDLSRKPDWFLAISPLGKTPVLRVGDTAIFESAVILEYLEETQPRPLHPADPVERAAHRGWIEVASTILNVIAALYSARDAAAFDTARKKLRTLFEPVEMALGDGTYFAGDAFTLVDAAFGPVFRYFGVFDRTTDLGILDGLPKIAAWRRHLASRPSIRNAVGPDYPERLTRFVEARGGHLASIIPDVTPAG